MKKWFLFMLILGLAAVALAQDAPSRIQTQPVVLADLASRVGRASVTLSDIGGWSWSYGTYNFVLGSGCIGAPATDPASSRWQRWEMPYNGTTYVYLITDNAQTLILCNAAALTTATAPAALPTAVVLPTVGPVIPTATVEGNASTGSFGSSTTTSECLLPPRLTVGGSGRVTPGDPNWLRQDANQASAKLGEIEGGGEFLITQGPICDAVSGVNYWFVVGDLASGWTGEGANGTYWLEPIETTPVVDTNTVIDTTTVTTLHSAGWVEEFQKNIQIQNVIFSPNANYFVVVDPTGRAALYNASTQKLISELRSPGQQAFTKIRFSVDDTALATADVANSVYFWDVANVRALGQITVDKPITALAFSSDSSSNRLLAVATSDGQVRLWGTTGLAPQTPPLMSLKIEGLVDALDFSPDNRMLIARDINEKMLALWEVGE